MINLEQSPAGARCSIVVKQIWPEQHVLLALNERAELKTASAAKLLVLMAVAEAIDRGALDPDQLVDKRQLEAVGYAGIWHHLRQPALAVDDLAKLVGSVSDNLATNGLIKALGGVERVRQFAVSHGITGVELHDIVRQQRLPAHPPAFSSGSASGYSSLLERLWEGNLARDAGATRVLEWLRDGMDLSMVAEGFNIDPLSHHEPTRGLSLYSKTGSDTGVRADCGIVSLAEEAYAYVAIINWDAEKEQASKLDEVLKYLRNLGAKIQERVESGSER